MGRWAAAPDRVASFLAEASWACVIGEASSVSQAAVGYDGTRDFCNVQRRRWMVHDASARLTT